MCFEVGIFAIFDFKRVLRINKTGSIIFVVGKSPIDIMEPILL